MIEKCNKCGTPLENTPSGQFSACPKGHGRLHPRIIVKPFDIKEVPREVALCPECEGCLAAECNEWTDVDGISRPTQAGLLIYCHTDSPYRESDALDDSDDKDEENHLYRQCDWVHVNQKVYEWLGAVE